MNISFSCYSEIGKREKNEDSFSVKEDKYGLLAVVADGLGGHAFGEVASGCAVEAINQYLQDKEYGAQTLEQAIIKANSDICDIHSTNEGAQTTVAALWIGDHHALAMHVGDTRIYQFRGGNVVFRSKDHTYAQLAVENGEITADEIRIYPYRNYLYGSLGNDAMPDVEKNVLELKAGDLLLICSDGFWEKILDSEMMDCADDTRDAEVWLARMRRVVSPFADDNNTAIAVVVN